MARIFITGAADGLGQLAAKALIDEGHQVVLHARNEDRARDAITKVPDAETVLIADLASMEETKILAKQVNESGRFDAIIHNAGVYRVPSNSVSRDGLPLLFAVNSLAPYILTCLISKPKRLIYLSSGMHLQGDPDLKMVHGKNNEIGSPSYSDTKLHDVILAMAVARKWPGVYSNAVDPGWVPTKMGGKGAPGSLEKGVRTQVWLAVSNDEKAKVSGRYFHHQNEARYLPEAGNIEVQETLLAICENLTGIAFPHDQ